MELNIVEFLRDAPTGLELYSPMCGPVRFRNTRRVELSPNVREVVVVEDSDENTLWFFPDGRYAVEGECLLFPSKQDYINGSGWSCWQHIMGTIPGSVIVDIVHNSMFVVSSGKNIITDAHGTAMETSWDGFRYATDHESDMFYTCLEANGYYWDNAFDAVRPTQDALDAFRAVQGLKPFDKVLTRDDGATWHIDFFEYPVYRTETGQWHAHCMTDSYDQCVPYNDETMHLLGTTKECPAKYKSW